MTQMEIDYTLPVEAVIVKENEPDDGWKLFQHGESFYAKNGELLAAHKRAARVFEEMGVPVPPKFLTELTRYFSLLGRDGVARVAMAYFNVPWKRDKPYAISNDTTPWLGRWLQSVGFDVFTKKSKIDKYWEEAHGNG